MSSMFIMFTAVQSVDYNNQMCMIVGERVHIYRRHLLLLLTIIKTAAECSPCPVLAAVDPVHSCPIHRL